MNKFILAFIFSSLFSLASAMCVSNSSGGIFCYEPLPPIDTTLPPLTWFVTSGGPTIPGMNIGILDQLDHDIAVLGDHNISIKEISTSAISIYSQIMALSNMEGGIQKRCSEPNSARNAWWGLCHGLSGRVIHLDKSKEVLEKAIFELKGSRPQLPMVARLYLEVKNSLSQYKKLFISRN